MIRHTRLSFAACGVRRPAGPPPLRHWSCASSSSWSPRRRRSRRRRSSAAASPGAAAPAADAPTDVDLLVGRSTVVNVGTTIARVSLTVPDIADAMVTAPTQLLIHGKQPGTISLFVWDRAGAIKTYEVKVRRDLTRAHRPHEAAVPGRGDRRPRQRQGRRGLRHRLQQVRNGEGGRRRRRLRREEGERRQPAAAAGRRRVQPGDAARALRRGQPQRAAGARRVVRRGRIQERLVRPHDARSSSPRRSGTRTASSCSATS